MDQNYYTRNDDYFQIFNSFTETFVSFGQIQTGIANKISDGEKTLYQIWILPSSSQNI